MDNMILNRIISIVIGYFCGIFLSGYAYSKSQKKDITKMGSGNAGMTNTYRIFGWKAGLVTLLGDISKPVIAIIVTWLIFHKNQPETVRLLQFYAGFGSIIGHNFPFYMKKFKGGKGIACTGGLVLAFCPIIAPISFGVLLGALLLTHYMSLGSILGLITFFIQFVIYGEMGWLNLSEAYQYEFYVIVAIIAIMGIAKHRANISRLLHGTENKFYFTKKKEE